MIALGNTFVLLSGHETEAHLHNQKSLIRSGRFEKWSHGVAGGRQQASLSRGSPKMFPRTLKTRRRHQHWGDLITLDTTAITTLFILIHP
jgi:hypothetical protein